MCRYYCPAYNGPLLFCSWASVLCRLSSSVTLPAGGPAGRRARGRSARRRPGTGRSGGRHWTAGQSCYVPLGRHLFYGVRFALLRLLCYIELGSIQCDSDRHTYVYVRSTTDGINTQTGICTSLKSELDSGFVGH